MWGGGGGGWGAFLVVRVFTRGRESELMRRRIELGKWGRAF